MLDAHLEDLAYHYYEAGLWEKALEYEQRVGEKALELYAQHAAIDHFTHALSALDHLPEVQPSSIYYLRGQAFETLGEFEHAQGDYEHAVEAALSAHDRLMEWQSVMSLGVLWTGRDYDQAGAWFRRASNLAEGLADSILHARSLNRLGNWLVNTGRTEEGIKAHQEALRIFEMQQDIQGVAETLDLLGTANALVGDTVKAVQYIGQAIELFRALGDQQRLLSCLAGRALSSSQETIETTFSSLRTRNECVQDTEEALSLARQTSAQAELALVEFATTHVLASFGEFGPALAHAQEALRIATVIEHQQWIVATYASLGQLYMHVLEPALAISALEAGLARAQTLGSSYWNWNLTSYLALAFILKRELPRAEAALKTVMPREKHLSTLAERQVTRVLGELALAQGEPRTALHIAEQLCASAPGDERQQPIPHLLVLKGEALLALKRLEEAATALEDARLGAQQRGALSVLWRIHGTLGRTFQLLKREDQAQHEYSTAIQIIAVLAGTIDQPYLREHFVEAARQTLPTQKSLPSRRKVPEKFDGLTEREIEVLRAVAQGLTDTQVAERLIISPRTVHSHLNSIYSKLSITSRSAATRYAIKHNLA
jgi:tetratricopeptide (TPR) repeat protein/DNA-binding CsgD family transcriptional regulator